MTAWELSRREDSLGLARLPSDAAVPHWALGESTFDTDRVLVPDAQADAAVAVRTRAGHTISHEEQS